MDKETIIRGIDPEWTTDGLGTLICPCGSRVEDDGRCPDGHVSPLLRAGLI